MSPAHLTALRAGALAAAAAGSSEIVIGAPGGAAARVAAIQRRAVTLLLAGDALVTLLPEGTPLHPWAATVPFAPLLAALPREPVRIVLEAAEIAPLRLRRRPERLPARTLDLLRRSAARYGTAPAADPFDAELTRALARLQRGGGAALGGLGGLGGLAGLVGLGPGLTPAADDVLVGLLAGLDLMSETSAPGRRARQDLVAALGLAGASTGQSLRARTTALSAQMLAAAAEGLYAEPLLELMERVDPQTGAGRGANSQGDNGIEAAVAALAAMGHRSGIDTLRGFVAALGIALPGVFR